ncbi:MAG: MGMT family protein [Eubacteriales bacterium]
MNGEIKGRVYDYLTRIPRGKVVTYGMIAEHLGNPKMARAIGNILHANPDGVKFPCYKVVNSKGELSERYAFGGKEEQKRLLQNDGVCTPDDKVDLEKYLWK